MKPSKIQKGNLMRTAFLLLLLVLSAGAQTPPPGTVAVVTSVTINAAAGSSPTNISCTFTANPSASQITSTCQSGGNPAATLSSTFPSPVPTPGTIGNFTLNGNTITWAFVPATAPNASATCPAGVTTGMCWSVVANGTAKNGNF